MLDELKPVDLYLKKAKRAELVIALSAWTSSILGLALTVNEFSKHQFTEPFSLVMYLLALGAGLLEFALEKRVKKRINQVEELRQDFITQYELNQSLKSAVSLEIALAKKYGPNIPIVKFITKKA